MTNLALAAAIGFGLFANFDVYWFLRLIYTHLSSFWKPGISITNGEESVVYGVCTTTDIDYFCHMNNGRYMREMDFGRFDFYFRSGLGRYLSRLKGVRVVQHAAILRYRRSLDFLMPYRLHTRLVWYDHRSLYFEQRFVSVRDDFVRAIAISKNTAVNCDVARMFADYFGIPEPPECPESVRMFIESNEQSSLELRRENAQVGMVPNMSYPAFTSSAY